MSEPVLGRAVTGTLTADQIDLWDVPHGVTKVTITTAELQACCPVTGQPDIYECAITYEPDGWIAESKAVKMWLVGFRDQRIGAEALTARIAHEFALRVGADTHVVTRQQVRGGLTIVTEAVA